MATAENLLKQALKMKPADKFIILEGLLSSLDEPDQAIAEIWAVEAEKRLTAYKAGRVKTLTYAEVFGEQEEAA